MVNFEQDNINVNELQISECENVKLVERGRKEDSELQVLIKEQIPVIDIVNVIKEGLMAEKVEQGRVIPDHNIRHKFLDTALNVRGDKSVEKPTIGFVNLLNIIKE
jgi:hypothetical protein